MATRFDASDHARVTEAVTAAERLSDGEIVTIVAESSDRYRDTALTATIALMLGVPVLALFAPYAWIERLLSWGWADGPVYRELLGAVFAAEILLGLLAWPALRPLAARVALTPARTEISRVRRRAIQYFRASAEKRTVGRTGVLIYLSLAERRAEIVADAAIHAHVDPVVWTEAMAALIARIREGAPGEGLAEAVTRVGAVLAEHFPKSGSDPNELPDRLIEL